MPMFQRNFRTAGGQILNAAPVAVPADFVGINANYWPLFNANLPSNDPCYRIQDPQFPYSLIRTLTVSLGRLTWWNAEQTADTYTWTDHDAFFNGAWMVGRKAIYPVWSTPTPWATGNGYTAYYGTYGNASTRLGSSGPPTNAAKKANFVTALLNRYGSKIKAVEVQNEPKFNGATNNQCFIGTMQECIDKEHKPVWDAVQAWNTANGGNVKVFCPAWYGNNNSADMFTYMAMTETGGTGRRAIDMCDGISIHSYNNNMAPAKRDVFNDGGVGLLTQIAVLQAALGTTKEIHMDEIGYASGASDAWLTAWLARSSDERVAWLLRLLFLVAVSGVKSASIYAIDNILCGNFQKDAALNDAMTRFAAAIPGQTIAAGATLNANTGAVSFTTGAGSFTW